jgi:hypothetical protein
MEQKANIYAQGSQERNRYLGEYAGMQGMLGQKMADTNLMVSDLNSRNAAAQRNYNAAAMGQLSQFSQVQQQMANQRRNDTMMLDRFNSFFNSLSGKSGVANTMSSVSSNQSLGMPNASRSIAGLNNMVAPPSYPVDPAMAWQLQGRTDTLYNN